MTVFSRLSQFGMMFKPLTADRGEELLMSYRAAFHAKTSPQPEREQESTGSGQECGEKWHGSFVKYDQNSCSWRTHQCSLLGGLELFSETWPRWGLMRDGECWEQQMLVSHTSEIESGSPDGETFFHTPNTTGLDGGSNSRKALKKRMEKFPNPTATDYLDQPTSKSWKAKGAVNYKLSNPEIRAMWPTPRSCSAMAATITPESAWDEKRFPNLETVVGRRMWTTPVSDDTTYRKNKYAQGGTALSTQAGGKLNPMWVEWLMGWPLGWTDLKPLEMDKFQKWQEQHGNY